MLLDFFHILVSVLSSTVTQIWIGTRFIPPEPRQKPSDQSSTHIWGYHDRVQKQKKKKKMKEVDKSSQQNVCACSCRTWAVILSVIWSSGCVCPLWLQRTRASWRSLTSFHTTWVTLPHEHAPLIDRSFSRFLLTPYRRRELTAACWATWHSWRPDRPMFAPFTPKTWCRMTCWWVPCWHSSQWQRQLQHIWKCRPFGQNCSRSWCTEVICGVQQLLKGQAVVIRVSRRVHDDFFRKVSRMTAQRCQFLSHFSGPVRKAAARLFL